MTPIFISFFNRITTNVMHADIILLYRPHPKPLQTSSASNWGREQFCLLSWCFYASVSIKIIVMCIVSSTLFSSPNVHHTDKIAIGIGTALDKMLAKVQGHHFSQICLQHIVTIPQMQASKEIGALKMETRIWMSGEGDGSLGTVQSWARLKQPKVFSMPWRWNLLMLLCLMCCSVSDLFLFLLEKRQWCV